jgi:hypothetical protein
MCATTEFAILSNKADLVGDHPPCSAPAQPTDVGREGVGGVGAAEPHRSVARCSSTLTGPYLPDREPAAGALARSCWTRLHRQAPRQRRPSQLPVRRHSSRQIPRAPPLSSRHRHRALPTFSDHHQVAAVRSQQRHRPRKRNHLVAAYRRKRQPRPRIPPLRQQNSRWRQPSLPQRRAHQRPPVKANKAHPRSLRKLQRARNRSTPRHPQSRASSLLQSARRKLAVLHRPPPTQRRRQRPTPRQGMQQQRRQVRRPRRRPRRHLLPKPPLARLPLPPQHLPPLPCRRSPRRRSCSWYLQPDQCCLRPRPTPWSTMSLASRRRWA